MRVVGAYQALVAEEPADVSLALTLSCTLVAAEVAVRARCHALALCKHYGNILLHTGVRRTVHTTSLLELHLCQIFHGNTVYHDSKCTVPFPL